MPNKKSKGVRGSKNPKNEKKQTKRMEKNKKERKKICVSAPVGIILIIIFVLLITALVLYPSMFWEKKNDVEEIATETEDIAEEREEEISYRDTLSDEDIERDIELEMIEIALYTYYAEHERFPDGLDGLKPDFMDEVPKVPGTEDEYTYTVGDDNQSFEISVALGEGGKE